MLSSCPIVTVRYYVVLLSDVILSSCPILLCPPVRYYTVLISVINLCSCPILCCPRDQYYAVLMSIIMLYSSPVLSVPSVQNLAPRIPTTVLFLCTVVNHVILSLPVFAWEPAVNHRWKIANTSSVYLLCLWMSSKSCYRIACTM